MKIKIVHDLTFHEESNLKACYNYLSITEPEFIEENALKSEFCSSHKIELPKDITEIFNPNEKKVISVLSIDKDGNKKFVCHPVTN